ncbi:hypothetical protein D3C81_2259430 [compost metagenome]
MANVVFKARNPAGEAKFDGLEQGGFARAIRCEHNSCTWTQLDLDTMPEFAQIRQRDGIQLAHC